MKLIRAKQVVHVTGLSRGTIYRLERAGTFPSRRRLSPNSVAWIEKEIAEWMESRPALSDPQASRAA